MEPDLPLKRLGIEGFRGIRELELPELAQVNLFVGSNNAGKSSVLEAIRLYVEGDYRYRLRAAVEIVQAHADLRPQSYSRVREQGDAAVLEGALAAVQGLFYSAAESDSSYHAQIGVDVSSTSALHLSIPVLENSDIDLSYVSTPEPLSPNSLALRLRSGDRATQIHLGGILLPAIAGRRERLPRAQYIGSTGVTKAALRILWSKVTLAGREHDVETALRILLPDLERVSQVADVGQGGIVLKLNTASRPVPLQSMGDGVVRIFGIAAAMVLAQSGVLLIDEIENGLHHTVQAEVWDAVFQYAETLDVQVFATTHSWETVVAFQSAANRSPADGILYRLERDADGRVHVERYTEAELSIAAEHAIEVR
jgi:predicted ATPase